MDIFPWLFAVCGITALLAAILPGALHRVPVSVPMVFLTAGIVAFAAFDGLFDPNPFEHGAVTMHLTEVCVIVALMGAGLALDRPVGWRRWATTWRLLAITMPLSIVVVAWVGWAALGLAPAAAVLLAAAVAPTDPVLASDVQVGEPTDEEGNEDDVRFSLTSEAGLNDGLAFPFTYAAIAMATVGADPRGWFGKWLAVDLLYRISVGVLAGLAIGWVLGQLVFRPRRKHLRLSERTDGFVALAATFLAYGAAEVVEGYGFVAVFVCAVSMRAAERSHGYHVVLHDFIDQIERLLTVVVLLLLGGAIGRGLLDPLTVADVAVAVIAVFVVRPVFGWLGLVGAARTRRERAAIAFFGVRGIGSIYYLAYGLEKVPPFPNAERLWALVGLVVTLSVFVHGVCAKPTMSHVDAKREEREEMEAHDARDLEDIEVSRS